jgi:hypothetical protein
MTEHWLRTDEMEEAVSGLEAASEWSAHIAERADYWKWVILALHNATQGFMVLALRGSDGLRPLKNHIAAEWRAAYREGGKYPVEELDSFLNLYKKVKSDDMLFFAHSKKFVPVRSQGRSIKRLNLLRNNFVHFLPRSWSLEVSGLPQVAEDCLALVEFLGFESGNVVWFEEILRDRTSAALTRAQTNFAELSDSYAA